MALFGRRKPGFAKDVSMKPSEIPGEFSDALDPAMQRAAETPAAEGAANSKPDIFDYMQSLPEPAMSNYPDVPIVESISAAAQAEQQLL